MDTLKSPRQNWFTVLNKGRSEYRKYNYSVKIKILKSKKAGVTLFIS